MTKRALIAEPDHDEALRQAAILKDEGFDATVFTQGDLVVLVEREAPDLLVLRHERPGTQTGLALVPRLKSVAPDTAIVLTTSDLTPDAIDKSRKQRVHAEWYLRLPAAGAEFVAAARAMPEKRRRTARTPSR
jgi:DNA-binding response OmpR family regulator